MEFLPCMTVTYSFVVKKWKLNARKHHVPYQIFQNKSFLEMGINIEREKITFFMKDKNIFRNFLFNLIHIIGFFLF